MYKKPKFDINKHQRRTSKRLNIPTVIADEDDGKEYKAKIFENGRFIKIKNPDPERFPSHRIGYGQYLKFHDSKVA